MGTISDIIYIRRNRDRLGGAESYTGRRNGRRGISRQSYRYCQLYHQRWSCSRPTDVRIHRRHYRLLSVSVVLLYRSMCNQRGSVVIRKRRPEKNVNKTPDFIKDKMMLFKEGRSPSFSCFLSYIKRGIYPRISISGE